MNSTCKICQKFDYMEKQIKKTHYVARNYTLFSRMFVYLHGIKLINSSYTLYEEFVPNNCLGNTQARKFLKFNTKFIYTIILRN